MPGTLNISRDAIFPPIDLIDYNSERAKLITNLAPEACREYFGVSEKRCRGCER